MRAVTRMLIFGREVTRILSFFFFNRAVTKILIFFFSKMVIRKLIFSRASLEY